MDLRVAGFEWDAGNRDKCSKHGVSPAVIERLFDRPLAVFPDPAHSAAEERLKAIGTADDGCSVLIVFTLKSSTMKKPLPTLPTNQEAEAFVADADLTDYDLSGMRMLRFEFQPKSERVNMRLPRPLLDAVKASAARAGVPYQRFIRQTLEQAVQSSK